MGLLETFFDMLTHFSFSAAVKEKIVDASKKESAYNIVALRLFFNKFQDMI